MIATSVLRVEFAMGFSLDCYAPGSTTVVCCRSIDGAECERRGCSERFAKIAITIKSTSGKIVELGFIDFLADLYSLNTPVGITKV
jgi:hypothetical protein